MNNNVATLERPKSRTNIVGKDVLREVQLETLETIAMALKNSYGPDGSTTTLRVGDDSKGTGITSYTKDGHRILSNIRFSFPIESGIREDLEDITRNTVKTVGDGTTSAVLMSYYIFKYLKEAHDTTKIAEKKLALDLLEATKKICEKIEERNRPATIDDIYWIAYTATDGDEEIASHIKELYERYGMGVYIDVGISNTEDDVVKYYDGYTIESGYFNTAFVNRKNGTFETRDAHIYIFEDPIDTPEMMALLNAILFNNIVNPIEEDYARQQDPEKFKNKFRTVLKPTVVFAPRYGADIRTYVDKYIAMLNNYSNVEDKPPFLLVTNIDNMESIQDLSTLTGAKLIKKYIDPTIQKKDIEAGLAPTPDTVSTFGGHADNVIADSNTTRIINPANMFSADSDDYSETYKSLLTTLEAKLHNMEQTKTEVVEMNKLRRRIQTLKGNVVDYLIGGISYTDRDAVKDLVEDAVLNCRNAAANGVGFGANMEGFIASNELEKETYTKDQKYNIYAIINHAYLDLISSIYDIYCEEHPDIFPTPQEAALASLTQKCPFNIRTEDFDGHVLTSIKADQVILDAISKIVGLMFKTNQYIVQNPAINVYTYTA